MSEVRENFSPDSIILEQIKQVAVKPIGEVANEKANKYIADRLDALGRTTTPTSLPLYTGIYEGFIHPDTHIKPAAHVIPFKIDDPAIYNILISKIGGLLRSGESHITEHTPQLVSDTVSSYLMGFYGRRNPNITHSKYYDVRTKMAGENFRDNPISIKDLAGHGIAVCVEHASLAHNLLMFLGENVMFVDGKLNIAGDTKGERHAYEIIRKGLDDGILFDPTNPIDETGKAALYPLGIDGFKTLMNGEEIKVGSGENQRIYTGPNYPQKLIRLEERQKALEKP